MNLYQSITQRKSCRKYDMQPLTQDLMNEIENAIKGFERLSSDLPIEYRFTQKVKGPFHVEAPHYLTISGPKSLEKENVGFLFEQLALWFDAKEIGCVWLGEAKDNKTDKANQHIITMAFGHAAEPIHRTREEFKRNPIDTITNAPDDACIQAAHLAPSGMNTQPWYFELQNDKVMVYKKKLKPPVSLIYKHSDIDMGIGLCHYALACKENGKLFHFSRSTKMPDKAGYLPFGIIN